MSRHVVLRYLSGGLSDQAFTSATSFVLSIAVLREATEAEAIEFSLVFIGFNLIASLVRSVTAEPYAVFRYSPGGHDPAGGGADGTHLMLSLAVGALGVLALKATYPLETGLAHLSMLASVFAVGVFVLRSDLAAQTRQWAASMGSGFQFLLVALGAVVSAWANKPIWAVTGWLLGSAVVVVLALISSARHGRWGPILPETWGYCWEFIVTAGVGQAALLIGSWVLNPSLAVVSRVGLTSYGPYQVLFQALSLMAIPFFLGIRPGLSTRSQALLTSGVLLGGFVLWTLALVPILGLWGEALFGASWSAAQAYLPFFIIGYAPSVVTAGIFVAMRATANVRASVILRIIAGIAQLVLPMALGFGWGMAGFFIGNAVAGILAGLVGVAFIARFGKPAVAGALRGGHHRPE